MPKPSKNESPNLDHIDVNYEINDSLATDFKKHEENSFANNLDSARNLSKEEKFLEYSLSKLDRFIQEDIRLLPIINKKSQDDQQYETGEKSQIDLNTDIFEDMVPYTQSKTPGKFNDKQSELQRIHLNFSPKKLDNIPKFETNQSFKRKIQEGISDHKEPGKEMHGDFNNTLLHGKIMSMHTPPRKFNFDQHGLKIIRQELRHSGVKSCQINSKNNAKGHLLSHLNTINVSGLLILVFFLKYFFIKNLIERCDIIDQKNQGR